jgi:hypothetical protein
VPRVYALTEINIRVNQLLSLHLVWHSNVVTIVIESILIRTLLARCLSDDLFLTARRIEKQIDGLL